MDNAYQQIQNLENRLSILEKRNKSLSVSEIDVQKEVKNTLERFSKIEKVHKNIILSNKQLIQKAERISKQNKHFLKPIQ